MNGMEKILSFLYLFLGIVLFASGTVLMIYWGLNKEISIQMTAVFMYVCSIPLLFFYKLSKLERKLQDIEKQLDTPKK